MSLHFIIDGYNLIKQAPSLNKGSLEESRLGLIQFLKIFRPQGNNNPVTVVFDGKKDNYQSGQNFEHSGVRIIFSQNPGGADEIIKQLVRNSKNPKNIAVVTNDRDIQLYVRQCRAQVRRVEEFLIKFNSRQPGLSLDDKMRLSAQEAAEITEEMKKLWLK